MPEDTYKNVNILDDVCKLFGKATLAFGHVEAEITSNGNLTITLKYTEGQEKTFRVDLTPVEWERLVAWVEWRRKDNDLELERLPK